MGEHQEAGAGRAALSSAPCQVLAGQQSWVTLCPAARPCLDSLLHPQAGLTVSSHSCSHNRGVAGRVLGDGVRKVVGWAGAGGWARWA